MGFFPSTYFYCYSYELMAVANPFLELYAEIYFLLIHHLAKSDKDQHAKDHDRGHIM